MNARNRTSHSATRRTTGKKSRRQLAPTHIIPALVIAGMSAPVQALELGEVVVESSLGQPLRASIAFALGTTEQLFDFCVALNGSSALADLPALSKAKLAVAGNRIVINGSVPIREPLLSMRLTVDCPYTAHLSREYMLFVDPPGVIAPAMAAAVTVPATNAEVVASNSAPVEKTTVGVRQKTITEPVPMGSEYRVRAGDSLSDIVSRIPNRQLALWPAVDAVFQQNVAAFVDGDINRLRAGTVLLIPDFSGAASSPSVSVATTTTVPSSVPAAVSSDTLEYDGYAEPAGETTAAVDISTPAAPISIPETVVPDFADRDTEVAAEADSADKVATLRPGDLFVASEVPADATVEGNNAGNVPEATKSAPSSGATSNALAFWIAGAGLALLGGLLVFGRRIRDRLAAPPSVAVDAPTRRITDLDSTAGHRALSDLDFELAAPSPGERAIVLDADLGKGTGLNADADMHVAQDFGFSVDTDNRAALDLEIPESRDAAESLRTDIIPPIRTRANSILDSEVPPSDSDDGEYDLSMIVDATRQSIGDSGATTKDLMAIQVPAETTVGDESGSYTLSKEVDFQVLEQDYEDELTATQALNIEIEKAAQELANQMRRANADEPTAEMPRFARQKTDTDLTAEMPVAAKSDDTAELTANLEQPEVTDNTVELTTELPANAYAENDEFISDLDDTGVNEELTAEMNYDDDYVDMDIESATIDTKKIAS